MKMVFFGCTDHGMPAGFCSWRSDGRYDLAGFFFDEGEHVIDVQECATFNDAKRHRNELAGWDPEEGIDDWGNEPLATSETKDE